MIIFTELPTYEDKSVKNEDLLTDRYLLIIGVNMNQTKEIEPNKERNKIQKVDKRSKKKLTPMYSMHDHNIATDCLTDTIIETINSKFRSNCRNENERRKN